MSVDRHYYDAYLKILQGGEAPPSLANLLQQRPGAITELFIESCDPELDGEAGETATYRLLFCLAYVGDDRFSEALSQLSGRRAAGELPGKHPSGSERDQGGN